MLGILNHSYRFQELILYSTNNDNNNNNLY